jgi:alpha-L-rhamnosidase
MMRWWWFGPAVEPAELERELRAIAAAGFGGVEVSFVYPLSPVPHPFGSEGLSAALRFAADRASELGLRFDVTLGSGWSYGGPHITADLAARRLRWEKREIQSAAMTVSVTEPWPGDLLVAAYLGNGSVQEPPAEFTELPVYDALIRIPEGPGPRLVLLAYSALTGQYVKRVAAGAEGPVLDHYSAAAARQHLRCVGEPLVAAVPPRLIGSVFCDSLEVYGADWTPELMVEFGRRRGYDAQPELYKLVVDCAGSGRFRADFYRTLTELYEQNFVAVIQRWAADHGLRFRIQGYGVPPASVSSYRFADLYEGEGWAWKEITQTRWASSAAHLYGNPVVSSEVWTWVHSPSFRATPLDLKGEAHEHLLAGVNQFVGHGWPYSPPGAPGLGWFFYAAGAIDDRNPWWPAMSALNAYLHRLCWLLRQGEHVADVRIYVPASDVYAGMGQGGSGSLDLWRESRRHIGPDIPGIVRESGLDFDLIDDDAVGVIAPADAGVVILPFASALPAATRAWLDSVVAAGSSVLSVGNHPGNGTATDLASLRDALADVAAPDVTLTPPVPDVGVVHRTVGAVDLYLVVNTGNEPVSFGFSGRTGHRRYEEWDASLGGARRAGAVHGSIPVELHPYQATVIVTFDGPRGADAPGPEADREEGTLLLDGGWQVEFLDEKPRTVPKNVFLPHRWEDERSGYSGAAAYETDLHVERAWLDDGRRIMLDFGPTERADLGSAARNAIRGTSYRAHVCPPIRDVGVVSVNGAEIGMLWAPPYEIDLSGHLEPGANRLRVVVYNTAANALACDTASQQTFEGSTARFGRRFRVQDLDLALERVVSGLMAVPRIRWFS